MFLKISNPEISEKLSRKHLWQFVFNKIRGCIDSTIETFLLFSRPVLIGCFWIQKRYFAGELYQSKHKKASIKTDNITPVSDVDFGWVIFHIKENNLFYSKAWIFSAFLNNFEALKVRCDKQITK